MKFLAILITINFSCVSSFVAIADEKNETSFSTKSAVDRFYVGSDGACDYSTIQAAINAAGSSVNPPEVLVADNKSYNENLFISTNNILIDGNYANCASARNGIHGGNRAKVRGFPASAIATMQISGLSVTIKNLQLDTNQGGGINAQGTSVITLENMLFFQLGDSAIDVGGNGQVDLRITNSTFLLNQADRGGAINCDGSTHSIDVTGNTGFANNTANRGGAVYLDRCEFSMSGGGFQSNESHTGGGIYAVEAMVDLYRVTFVGNMVVQDGGAIFANGSGVVTAEATHFLRNTAIRGGAVSIWTRAEFNLVRTNRGCFDPNKCNLFDGNTASEKGGAVFSNGGVFDISSTYFENNRANSGTAVMSNGSGQISKIEGSIFTQNGNNAAGGYDDRGVIQIDFNANISITYSTFADNNVLFSTFYLENNSSGTNQKTNISVLSSIIHDSDSGNVFDISGFSTHVVDCLLVHESGSFNANNARVTVADPLFIDAANQNYHIDAVLSPAVDYCTDAIAMAEHKDIDFQSRGFDIESRTNKFGPYDLGADESLGDDVFVDGFE